MNVGGDVDYIIQEHSPVIIDDLVISSTKEHKRDGIMIEYHQHI